jgi:hypothetical protein
VILTGRVYRGSAIASGDINRDWPLAVDLPAPPKEDIMLSVRPSQVWERTSIPGASPRELEVVNVLANQVKLRYLDMPNAPDLERVISTTVDRMLSESNSGLAQYKFVRG